MFQLVAGYEATGTVHIVNGESEPMQFTFVETSCHAAGYTVNLTVEPMHGTVPANSRFMWYNFIIWLWIKPSMESVNLYLAFTVTVLF